MISTSLTPFADRTAGRFNRAAAAVIIAALIPSLWVAVSALDMPQLGRFPDAQIYWVSAKSLADGSGYRILSLPGQPYQTKYPPLFPLLLAGVWTLDPNFPQNLRLATIVCWIALPLYLLLAARLFRRMGFGPGHAAAICVALALNPYVVNYSISPMSELWFSCALLACILATFRAGEPNSGAWTALAAGVIGGAAYLTRSAGLPLLVSSPLYFVLRKQHRRAAFFALGMLPLVAAWTLWSSRHAVHATDIISLYYTDYLRFQVANFSWRDIPVLVRTNTVNILPGAGHLILVLKEGVAPLVLGLAAIVGAVRTGCRGKTSPYHLYAAGLILMLLPWAMSPGDRYMRMLFPILPLLAAGLYGFGRDAAGVARRWYDGDGILPLASACVAGFVIVGTVLLMGIGTVRTFVEAPNSIARERKNLEADRAAFRWITTNLPVDATFLTGADPVLYLYTGRKACTLIVSAREVYFGRPAQSQDLGRKLADFARTHRLDYIFLNAGDSVDVSTGAEEAKPLYRSETAIFRPGAPVP